MANTISVKITGDSTEFVTATKQAADATQQATRTTSTSLDSLSSSADDSVGKFRGLADTTRGLNDVMGALGVDLPFDQITSLALAGKDLAKGFSDLIAPALQKVNGLFGETAAASEELAAGEDAAAESAVGLDAAEDANPFGALLLVVGLVTAGLLLLASNVGGVENALRDIGEFVQGGLTEDFTGFMDLIGAIGSGIEDAFSGAISFISSLFDDTIKPIIDALEDVGNAFNGVVSGVGSFFSGAFASGGVTPFNGVALVGENGPELVALPGGSRVMNATDTANALGGSSSQVTQVFSGGTDITQFVTAVISETNRKTKTAVTAGSKRAFI